MRLDSLSAAIRGDHSGPAIAPGDANSSLLLQAIRHQGDVSEMPPKEKLSDAQVEAVAKWITTGAQWPRSVLVLFDDDRPFVEALSKGKASIRGEREDLSSGEIAVAVGPRERFSEQISDWGFLIREHPQADRRTLIRRLSFDLTGLPPTPTDVQLSRPQVRSAFAGRSLPPAGVLCGCGESR